MCLCFKDVPGGADGRHFLREKRSVFNAAGAWVPHYWCWCCGQERLVNLSPLSSLSIGIRLHVPHHWPNCAWCNNVYYCIEMDIKRLGPVGRSLRQTLGEREHESWWLALADCRDDAVVLCWRWKGHRTRWIVHSCRLLQNWFKYFLIHVSIFF